MFQLKPEVEKVPLTWVSDMSANVSEAAPRGTAVTMIVATSTGQPLSQPIAYSLLSAVSGMSLYAGRKDGNVLFNDALNTFQLRLNGVKHVEKDNSDSKRENLLTPLIMAYSFRVAARDIVYASFPTL